ncbi:MAG TPA: PEP-CTERM sorting domain-containing protein [Fimbriimonadaceae bacterium]|nr:PEP-CTERM sorting domain-containing protein [Fimbriimonadaceae bacterium]
MFLTTAMALGATMIAGDYGQESSGVRLTGINGSPVSSVGNWHTGWYNTYGSSADAGKNAYVINGDDSNGQFVNSGNGAPTMIDVDLQMGSNKFLVFFDGNEIYQGRDYWSVNLFFEGQNTNPEVSAFSRPTSTDSANPEFFANTGAQKSLNGAQTVNGSGTLETTINGLTVRLTEFRTCRTDIYGLDRVNNFSLGTSGRNDHVTELNVEVVPEPASFAALAVGVAALRRRKRS